MMKCVFVCMSVTKNHHLPLPAEGRRREVSHLLWPSDDDDDDDDDGEDDDGDDDDDGGRVRGADAGTESHRSALHAQEPLPGWRARNLLKSCHSTNTW